MSTHSVADRPAAEARPVGDPGATRRGQILDAAGEAFAASGFHRTRIREIARLAGVAEGTIYNYFESKDDLLLGLLDRLADAERRPAAFGELADGDLGELLPRMLAQRFEAAGHQLPLLRALLPELLIETPLRERYLARTLAPLNSLAEAAFDHLVERGELRPNATELTVRLVAGMVLGVLVLRMIGDPVVDGRFDELPAAAASLLLDGLRPEGTQR